MRGNLYPCSRTAVGLAVAVLAMAVVSACMTATDEPEVEPTGEVTQSICPDPTECGFFWSHIDNDRPIRAPT